MAGGAVLLDLTPFTKVDIDGPHAVEELNHLSTAQMDIDIGKAVYTQMLNRHGGIEMDLTISRLRRDRFHLTSGAATRARLPAVRNGASTSHSDWVSPSRIAR